MLPTYSITHLKRFICMKDTLYYMILGNFSLRRNSSKMFRRNKFLKLPFSNQATLISTTCPLEFSLIKSNWKLHGITYRFGPSKPGIFFRWSQKTKMKNSRWRKLKEFSMNSWKLTIFSTVRHKLRILNLSKCAIWMRSWSRLTIFEENEEHCT